VVALTHPRIEFACDAMVARMHVIKGAWVEGLMRYRDISRARLEEFSTPNVLTTTLVYDNKPIARLSFTFTGSGARALRQEDLTT
jgi:hypothetical protein